jgi:hypothetical protein
MLLRLWVLGVALCVTCGLATPARAQEAPPDDEYLTILQGALAEYDAHNYDEAYALFVRAHGMRPSARTERALGKTAFELRHYIEAIRWLEDALGDTRSPLTDEMRAECESLIVRAHTFVGAFVIRADVEGGHVEVDTQPVEGDPSSEAGVRVDLDLGEHSIAVRAEGYETAMRQIAVRGGEHETLELSLVRTPDRDTVVRVTDDPGAVYRDVGWASVIAGGVFTVMGITAIALWANAVNNLNANLESRLCFADENENVIPGLGSAAPTCRGQESQYRLALPFAYVGLIGGGLLLATGLGLVLGAPTATPAEGDDDASVRIACGPFAEAGIACTGTF